MKRYAPNEAALAGFRDLIQRVDTWKEEALEKSCSEDGKERSSIEQNSSVAMLDSVRSDLLRVMSGEATEDEVMAFCQRMRLRTEDSQQRTEALNREVAYLRGQRQLFELGMQEDELVTVQ